MTAGLWQAEQARIPKHYSARTGATLYRMACAVLAGQPAQKFPLVHAVLEGFAPVDEYDRHFVVELAPQIAVAIYVHFLPREPTAAGELGKALLHYFAQVTALARINHNLARLWHGWIVAFRVAPIPVRICQEM